MPVYTFTAYATFDVQADSQEAAIEIANRHGGNSADVYMSGQLQGGYIVLKDEYHAEDVVDVYVPHSERIKED